MMKRDLKPWYRTASVILLMCGLFLPQHNAWAALYKCNKPGGGVYYTDKPCKTISSKARSATRPELTLEEGRIIGDPAAPKTKSARAAAAAEVPEDVPVAEADVVPFLRNMSAQSAGWERIMWVGMALAVLSWLFMIGHAWRMRRKLASVLMLILMPYCFIYPLISRSRALLIGLLFLTAGIAVSYRAYVPGVDFMRAEAGALSPLDGQSVPLLNRKNFSNAQTVWVITQIGLKPRAWEKHYQVEWVWYGAGQVIRRSETIVTLTSTPAVLRGSMPAQNLEAGAYHVEVLIDGELMHSEPFHIEG